MSLPKNFAMWLTVGAIGLLLVGAHFRDYFVSNEPTVVEHPQLPNVGGKPTKPVKPQPPSVAPKCWQKRWGSWQQVPCPPNVPPKPPKGQCSQFEGGKWTRVPCPDGIPG